MTTRNKIKKVIATFYLAFLIFMLAIQSFSQNMDFVSSNYEKKSQNSEILYEFIFFIYLQILLYI